MTTSRQLAAILFADIEGYTDFLEQLIKLPCGWDLSNSIPLYKTHPYWKLLQNNPRFQKLIQQ